MDQTDSQAPTENPAAPPVPEPRTCECLKTVKDRLEKHHGEGSEVELDLKMSINTVSLDIRMDLPPLYYSYAVKGKKGKRRKKSYVTFNFCPFCGKHA